MGNLDVLCWLYKSGGDEMVRTISWSSTMPHEKRKISDPTAVDANAILQALNKFQGSLDEDDDDLPDGLISALESFRTKIESIKVRAHNI